MSGRDIEALLGRDLLGDDVLLVCSPAARVHQLYAAADRYPARSEERRRLYAEAARLSAAEAKRNRQRAQAAARRARRPLPTQGDA